MWVFALVYIWIQWCRRETANIEYMEVTQWPYTIDMAQSFQSDYTYIFTVSALYRI